MQPVDVPRDQMEEKNTKYGCSMFAISLANTFLSGFFGIMDK